MHFIDIYATYQHVCRDWYSFAGNGVTVIKLDYTYSKRRFSHCADLLHTISNRFQNMEEIDFCGHGISRGVSLEKHRKKIILENINTRKHMKIIKREGNESVATGMLAHFPKYAAVSSFMDTQDLERHLKYTTITYVDIGHGSANESVKTIAESSAGTTMTHLSLSTNTKSVAEHFIMHLPNSTNLVFILSPFSRNSLSELLRRSPKLAELQTLKLSLSQAKVLAEHCPLLTVLEVSCESDVLDHILSHCHNLKVLKIEYVFKAISVDSYIEELWSSRGGEITKSLKHLKRLKFLKTKIEVSGIANVIQYCPLLEEISIHPRGFSNADIETLVRGCPKLRFVHSGSTSLTLPRVNSNVIDVIQVRANLK